ncbi:phytoene desaturase family protein [Leuconostocaceae bacterium ESL0958]|nr:phytoene desaturase family protein [Leuconostocaceae bacterium ESL0958]
MKTVSIVGAGVGGLTAAINLQRAGFAVTIYEQNDHAGGKMDIIEEDGFKFDTGPTIVMMPEIYQKPFVDAGVNPDDYFTMTRVEPIMDVYTQGKKLPLSSDLVTIAREFEPFGEGELHGFLNYLTDIYGKYTIAKKYFIYQSFRSPKDFYNPKTLWHAYQLKTFSSSFSAIQKNIQNTTLQYLLSFQTLYIGISPFSGPSIYNIIPMIELLYGVWFIKGGMYEYAKALTRLFEELGGKIVYQAQVDKIETANRHVTGLRINGSLEQSDAVVTNADFPYAMTDLLVASEADKGKYKQRKVDQLDYSMSCFLLYLGVDRQYQELNLHTIKMADDFAGNVAAIDQGQLPDDPSFYVYYPTALDDSFAPAGQSSLYVLVPVANLKENDDWDAQSTSAFAAKMIDKVAADLDLPDLAEHIVYQQVYTPKTFASRYNSRFGSVFGLKPTLRQSNYFRPHNKHSKIDNLYFAGASVHPGAGVPIVITSGELAAQEVIKDHS